MKNITELRQTQQQRQVQTASATQVMLSNIMEMPLADLEHYVDNELESNEALERNVEEADAYDAYAEEAHPGDEFGVRDSHTSQDEYDDMLTIDQVPEDRRELYNREISSGNGRSNYDGDTERQIADNGATSYDDILAQIGEHDLTDDEVTAMKYLVGSLDDSGYLSKDTQTLLDELTFQEYIYLDEAQLEHLIRLLQSFEPRGIGARNLRECLLLQMEVPAEERPRLSLVKRLAHKVVRDMFDDLMRARWTHIQDALDVDDDTIREIQQVFKHLNPRPGSSLTESLQSSAQTVIPDFRLYIDDFGEIVVTQHRGSASDLRISTSYAATVADYRAAQERARAEGRELTMTREQENAYNYALHKVEAAKAFIDNLLRRRHTLQAVMEQIARRQRDFFLNDDDETLLHPMVLRDIAEAVSVDISTVSRAVNSKFVETDFGTYPLKYFFGSEFTTADGDNVSQRHAMSAIRAIIEDEDPRRPFSDQKITELLAEEGLTIARRTVAKYRERMGFPTSSLRRR